MAGIPACVPVLVEVAALRRKLPDKNLEENLLLACLGAAAEIKAALLVTMNLKLSIDGQAQFNNAFDVLAEGITDFRPVWPEIELQFFRAELEQFSSIGARGGSQWAPLSKGYAKWKAKKYPGKPILQRTGRLLRSLSVIGGADSVHEAEPLSLTLGTRVPYAIHHQRGGKRLSQRPPLQLTRDDYGKFVSRIYRFAERQAKEAGFETKTSGGSE